MQSYAKTSSKANHVVNIGMGGGGDELRVHSFHISKPLAQKTRSRWFEGVVKYTPSPLRVLMGSVNQDNAADWQLGQKPCGYCNNIPPPPPPPPPAPLGGKSFNFGKSRTKKWDVAGRPKMYVLKTAQSKIVLPWQLHDEQKNWSALRKESV